MNEEPAMPEESAADSAPIVGWAATAPTAAIEPGQTPGLMPIGAALSIIAGIGGTLSVILPYANFIGGDAFRLIPVLDPESLGPSVWLGLEPLALAIGLVLLGIAGLVRPTRLGAGLTFGLGLALLLNHGGFLAYLYDPDIAGNPETGLLVGVGAGVLATIGGLISMTTRPTPRVAAA